MVEVVDDVVYVFEADGGADKFGADAGGALVLFGELSVAGGGGVQDECFGVADVGEVAGELDVVDKCFAGGSASFDAEAEDGAEAAIEVLSGVLVGRVVFEAWVGDPFDAGVCLEVSGEGEGVGGLLTDAQGQGLEALQEEEGVEGAGADVL